MRPKQHQYRRAPHLHYEWRLELPFGNRKQFLNNNGLAARVFGGWELAGIVSARTGLPVNITISRKAAAFPEGYTSSQRPNLVPGASIYAANQSISNWFNPAAFSTPANGTWGNLGRYIANGPGNYEFDTSLQKRFRLTERLGVNLRAAAYNLLTTRNTRPHRAKTSSGFGQITSTLNSGAVGTGAPGGSSLCCERSSELSLRVGQLQLPS